MFTLSSSSKVKKVASFTFRLSTFRFVPTWIIFFIDNFLSSLSFVFAFVLYFDFNKNDLIAHEGLKHLFITNLLVSLFIFSRIKTYTSIIRLTSLQDLLGIFLAAISNVLLLVFLKLVLNILNVSFELPMSVILCHFLILFFLLVSYRFLVKFTFQSLTAEYSSALKPVIVFGAGDCGRMAEQLINQEKRGGMKVVAFIDDDPNKVGKTIEGVKIYNARNDLNELIKKYRVEQVIFSIQHLEAKRKREVVDLCLLNNVKVVYVPSVKKWINGEFNINQLRKIKIEELLERDVIQINNYSIFEQISDKKILITGAAGSIGSEIVRQVFSYNPKVVVLCDIAETALYNVELELKEIFPDKVFQSVIVDIKNFEKMECVFKKYTPDYVFHAAAYKHVPMMEKYPAEAILNNVGGTKVVADLAIKYGVKKFVMISTDKAVNPTNVMGASKRIAEIYIQSLDDFLSHNQTQPTTKFITTRFGNVLGSNGSVIPRFKEQIEKGGPVTVTHPDINRYFMTIPEACQLVLEAGTMGNGGEIFVFDMGESVKIVDLAKKMIQLSGLTYDKDIQIVYTGLRPGEKLYEETLTAFEHCEKNQHEKIMIAKVKKYPFVQIVAQIEELLSNAATNNDNLTVQKMKQIVPEYKSRQSVFEVLDAVML
ncbi:polysaccharide biosynthesis protein [Solitalea koreensis]|uniref:NDP-sugar epimerase, includes UDP-GlcNAc-inverting 4,6-dehydratase FlaA1 and capsular polysaccharide biosynthesis protein EpsC n=1 Tax=Solitalea koreensis TaxID=543615 RepID=A0A521AMH7_9SPHI|nr:nucleoside-diphosphate sugar epimerase/dehydratase [Solitalea koreensis]SMO36009.1 NDP-sugar epimerase, includes UDP-GlcNAc-inverting 4,6-dehydratase FlaA1 and capsular polysaccharide biosynthesis protein EpsC [Solitalea koreensis]